MAYLVSTDKSESQYNPIGGTLKIKTGYTANDVLEYKNKSESSSYTYTVTSIKTQNKLTSYTSTAPVETALSWSTASKSNTYTTSVKNYNSTVLITNSIKDSVSYTGTTSFNRGQEQDQTYYTSRTTSLISNMSILASTNTKAGTFIWYDEGATTYTAPLYQSSQASITRTYTITETGSHAYSSKAFATTDTISASMQYGISETDVISITDTVTKTETVSNCTQYNNPIGGTARLKIQTGLNTGEILEFGWTTDSSASEYSPLGCKLKENVTGRIGRQTIRQYSYTTKGTKEQIVKTTYKTTNSSVTSSSLQTKTSQYQTTRNSTVNSYSSTTNFSSVSAYIDVSSSMYSTQTSSSSSMYDLGESITGLWVKTWSGKSITLKPSSTVRDAYFSYYTTNSSVRILFDSAKTSTYTTTRESISNIVPLTKSVNITSNVTTKSTVEETEIKKGITTIHNFNI